MEYERPQNLSKAFHIFNSKLVLKIYPVMIFQHNKQLYKEAVFQDLSTNSYTLNYTPIDTHVTDITNEISAASSEQSVGIDQVNQAIMQMDSVTQQNASLVEESAAAAASMAEEAQVLLKIVGEFKLTKTSSTPSARAKVARPVTQHRSKATPVKMVRSKPKLSNSSDSNGWEEF